MRIPFRRPVRVTPTPSQASPPTAGARATARPPALGNWRIAPTYLVERRRRRRYQVALLFPPPDFEGRARLSVIGSDERIEFSGAWSSAGHPADWDPAEAERFAPWLDQALAATGLGAARQTEQPGRHPWPLPFRLPQERGARRLKADLLLETAFEGDAPRRRATATIEIPLVLPASRVYLAILLSTRRAGHPDEVLGAAVREARRRREVRFGWSGASPSGSDPDAGDPDAGDPLAGGLRRLVGQGQAERLIPGADETGLPVAEIRPDNPTAGGEGARVRIDLASAEPEALPARYEGAIARPAPGEPDLIAAQPLNDRLRVIFRPAEILPFNPLLEGRETLATVFFHRVLAQGISRARIERGRRDLLTYHGFAVACWNEAAEWKNTGKTLARWNRSHGSPEILLATPSDMLTAIEELHRLGRVRTG